MLRGHAYEDDMVRFTAGDKALHQARAVIEAMREPTEAMIGASPVLWPLVQRIGEEVRAHHHTDSTATWMAMVDAALGEGE